MKYDPNETPNINTEIIVDGTGNDNEAVDKLDDKVEKGSEGV